MWVDPIVNLHTPVLWGYVALMLHVATSQLLRLRCCSLHCAFPVLWSLQLLSIFNCGKSMWTGTAEGTCVFGGIAVFPCRKKGQWEIGTSSKCKSTSSRSRGRWSSVRETAVSWVTSAGILCRGSSSLQMNWVYLTLRIYSVYCSVECLRVQLLIALPSKNCALLQHS